MVYILRTHVKSKFLNYGLSSVYGIGLSISNKICQKLGFQDNFLTKNLSEQDIFYITCLLDDMKILIKGDLQLWIKQRLDLLSGLRVYKGVRHRQGLPLRGQRTHTNARTVKKFRFKKS